MEKRNEKKCSGKRLPIQWFYCLVVFFAAQLVLASCSEEEVKEEPRLEVYPEEITLDETGKGTITILSNTTWEIVSQTSWLSFSEMSGKGDREVTLKVIERQTMSLEGNFVVKFKDGKISHEITVKIDVIQNELPDETFTVNGVSFKMIGITGGTFQMGNTATASGYSFIERAKPLHEVRLSSFSIGQTEVTQELWEAVMGTNPSYFKGKKRPVESVKWEECQTFITKLNQLTGKTFRLPTEAQWEFAARGGKKSQGYKYAGSNIVGDVAWFYENSRAKGSSSVDYGSHDVATKQPNELGIYDMSGNVWELCSDLYGSYYSSAKTNPQGSNTDSFNSHVIRGGSWEKDDFFNLVFYRSQQVIWNSDEDLGLRLAY